MHPLACCLIPEFWCMVLHYFNTHMQLYQLLADRISGFFEVWIISIDIRRRNVYGLCWFHVLTSLMDVALLTAWFFAAFLPSVFLEVDGNIIYFNEAEAVAALDDSDEENVKSKGRKAKGKQATDIQKLPVIPVEHKMTEEELIAEFGEDGWYQLEDEIYNRYRFTPMKVKIEEHHVGVYKSKKEKCFKKADYPAYLLRNSLVSPSLLAGIWNAK